ncbi:hypothetical protein GBAR_LOCUS22433, partial [Geodia barretti]
MFGRWSSGWERSMTRMQADVCPRNTVMASTNSGWPPLSTMYTHVSVKTVSREWLGTLMRDMNSSSTSDDSSRDSTVTSGAVSDDWSPLAVAAALVSSVAAGEDFWGEAADSAALGELCFSLTTVGGWVAGWPSFWARALRMRAMYCFFSSAV